MTLDKIEASADVVMTAELKRLFAAAGCDPTVCHACGKAIKVGTTFKLVPHNGTDEMCCAKCGEPELVRRDARRKKAAAAVRTRLYPSGPTLQGGYSRPSKPAGDNTRGAKP